MNYSKWMRLSSDAIAPPLHPADALWSIEYPSPYEIPSHARSRFDEETGCLLIEFKYFEQEPLVNVEVGQYITALVGKKTKRIWSIKFDVHSFNRDKTKITQVASATIGTTQAASNGVIAARAISSKGDALLQAAFG